jgi:hypothetical protein
MRPQLVKAGCAAAAILVAVILVEAQESRSRPTPSSTKPTSLANRPSGKSFEEEARELAHVLETNPMLEIKSKRMSPFSEVVLLRYVALGQKKMPMLVAAKQGRSSQVEALLKKLGAKIYFVAPEIDYLRCVVDTDKVMQVFDADDVLDVHLGMNSNIGNEFDGDGFPPPKFTPRAEASVATKTQSDKPATVEPISPEAFDRLLPHWRVALDRFMREHPTYDGRGVTIGQIDGGAMQEPSLLTGAKDLNGNSIPKFGNVYNMSDYDYEKEWESTDGIVNPNGDVLVYLSEPVTVEGSVLAIDGKVYNVPGPAHYRFGLWRLYRTEYPLLFNADTGQIWLDIEKDNSFSNNGAFGNFADTHIPFAYYSPANKPVLRGVFEIRSDNAIAVILHDGHATMSGVAAAGNSIGGLGPIGAAPGAQLSFAAMRASVYRYVEAALRMALDPALMSLTILPAQPVIRRVSHSLRRCSVVSSLATISPFLRVQETAGSLRAS